MQSQIILARLPRALVESGYANPPGFLELKRLASEGRFPATYAKGPAGVARWAVSASDLPKIAAALGLGVEA